MKNWKMLDLQYLSQLNVMSFVIFVLLNVLFFLFYICMLYLCKMGHLSCLNANEMLIYLNDLLYLRHENS